jgi:hypothetical protein
MQFLTMAGFRADHPASARPRAEWTLPWRHSPPESSLAALAAG